MQNRHYLEIALYEAIKAKNIKAAIKQIEAIQEFDGQDANPPSLTSADENGQSFLHFALDTGAHAIADKLFELQKNDKNVLFKRDKKHKTLIHDAIRWGHLQMVKELITISENELPDSIGYKFWLTATIYGSTPLLYAAACNHLAIVALLLEKINQEPNALELINQVNKFGYTPLYETSQLIGTEVAELLMRHGADIITDNDGKTLFENINNAADKTKLITYLARCGAFIGRNLPASVLPELQQLITINDVVLVGTSIAGTALTAEQISVKYTNPQQAAVIFKALEAEEKSLVLKHCAQRLKQHPALTNVKTFYYSCLGAHRSLAALVTAHVKDEVDTTTINKYVEAAGEESFIPEQILILAPDSAKKQKKTSAAASATELDMTEQVILSEDTEEEISLAPEHLLPINIYSALNKDRIKLHQLINDLQTYLADFQNHPRENLANKIRIIILASMCAAIFIAIEIWLVYRAVTNNNSKDEVIYILPPVLIGGGILYLILMLSFVREWIAPLWRKEATISPDEHHKLINDLETLLELLQDLENRELQEKQADPQAIVSYLPTASQNIRDLENQHAILNQANPVTTVINTITDEIKTLRTIQNDMNLSNKPFSLFARNKPDVVVSISEESDNEEDVPLLSHH